MARRCCQAVQRHPALSGAVGCKDSHFVSPAIQCLEAQAAHGHSCRAMLVPNPLADFRCKVGRLILSTLIWGSRSQDDQTILGLGQIRMIVTWQPFVLGACQFLQQATDERHAMRQYLPGAEQQ